MFEAEQLEFLAAARARYRFDDNASLPQIHADLGVGLFEFNLDLDGLQMLQQDSILPPIGHVYVVVGAGIRHDLVPRYLEVAFDISARLGVESSADMRNVFGIDTAPSHGISVGLSMRSELAPALAPGFFVGGGIQYIVFVTDFDGQVGCAVPEGCDVFVDPWRDTRPWEVWPVDVDNPDVIVGGPTGPVFDHYVRAYGEVGFTFR